MTPPDHAEFAALFRYVRFFIFAGVASLAYLWWYGAAGSLAFIGIAALTALLSIITGFVMLMGLHRPPTNPPALIGKRPSRDRPAARSPGAKQ
ncbi:hypothetical protein [Sphingomonas sp. BK345]|uniref:hypothetical protein n=1 Tax=Sphingomonas sp. BK345 TaxID=2586980 RepID=UPI00160F7D07|nr:hypothetical protein [Sphingomonas sp. BK345]MBB3475859.1 hypothetical protein [Sphingomonas sp. BK345]